MYGSHVRIRKGSDLPKKSGVTEHPTKIFTHQVNAKGHQLYILLCFDSLRAHEIHDMAGTTSCIACTLEMHSSVLKH